MNHKLFFLSVYLVSIVSLHGMEQKKFDEQQYEFTINLSHPECPKTFEDSVKAVVVGFLNDEKRLGKSALQIAQEEFEQFKKVNNSYTQGPQKYTYRLYSEAILELERLDKDVTKSTVSLQQNFVTVRPLSSSSHENFTQPKKATGFKKGFLNQNSEKKN